MKLTLSGCGILALAYALPLSQLTFSRLYGTLAVMIVLIPREAAPSFRNDAAPLFRELLAP